MKHYQSAIKLDDFLVAEFDYSVILHHVFSDKVLLVSSSVLSALQKLEQNVLYSVDQLTSLLNDSSDGQVDAVIKTMISEGLLK
ncbi:hypothetical protein [Neptunomonas sp.]|uniref:hypothetical protein n=1 Tax=Neptunomonas TaxID=75687 RepID=UPI003513125E